MSYDEWFEANADDLALHGAKATSRLVWNAAVAAERERCAMVALAWGETHDPSETVNARNAARKIACGIQGPN